MYSTAMYEINVMMFSTYHLNMLPEGSFPMHLDNISVYVQQNKTIKYS